MNRSNARHQGAKKVWKRSQETTENVEKIAKKNKSSFLNCGKGIFRH